MKQQIKLICLSLLFLLMIDINILASEDTTIIDVSNMSIGENVVHNHIYKSKYDDTNHWIECLVCHDKQNVTKHTITTTLAMGKESCDKNNYATKTCNCGYNTIYHKPCAWKGKYSLQPNNFYHWKVCAICNNQIAYSYYLNSYGSGTLYVGATKGDCKNSNGTSITCKTGGTCAECKQIHSVGYHTFWLINENIDCQKCNTNFGSYSITSTPNSSTPALYTTVVKISLKNGATFSSTSNLRTINPTPYSSQSNTYTTNSAKTTATINYKSQLNTTYKVPYSTYANFNILISGKTYTVHTKGWYQPIETTKPTISSMETNDVSFSNDDWILSKKIKISGIENYTNTVSIEVADENNEIAYSGTTSVSNKNYNFEFVPKIEANEIEKTYTINVTDANNNTTTKELIVKK